MVCGPLSKSRRKLHIVLAGWPPFYSLVTALGKPVSTADVRAAPAAIRAHDRACWHLAVACHLNAANEPQQARADPRSP